VRTRCIRLLVFLFIPVALLVLSCHKKVSKGWFPLVLGSTWTYNLTGSVGYGNFTITVTEVGGARHYAQGIGTDVVLSAVFPFNDLDLADTSRFYTLKQDTTWLGPDTGISPDLVIVQPMDVGDVWRWHDWLWTDSAVVSGKTDVIVPAGTFKNCYEVDYYGLLGQHYYRVCYAEGFGAVKGEGFTAPTWKFELVSSDLP
jgi:hypothetical protein